MAQAARSAAPDDVFARRCVEAPAGCVDPAAHDYLAALLEAGIAPLPEPVSGYAHTRQLQRERLEQMRQLALCALGCGGLGSALWIGRRGVTAGTRASRLLESDTDRARRARLRAIAAALASAGGMLLVFAVIALYVFSRGGY